MQNVRVPWKCLLGHNAVQLKGYLLKLHGNLSPPSTYPQMWTSHHPQWTASVHMNRI